jgi:hypothetical protein
MDCDLYISCVDTLSARQYANEMCARLMTPWLDAGVDSSLLVARVTAYIPGPDSPCLECGFSAEHYAALEQAQPCLGGVENVAPTDGISSLGALAASMLAIEARKLLSGSPDALESGMEIMLDMNNRQQLTSRLRRNQDCRFDHTPWEVGRAGDPHRISLGQALSLAGQAETSRARISHSSVPFATKIMCSSCGSMSDTLRLSGRLRHSEQNCGCGGRRVAPGFFLKESVALDDLTPAQLDCPMAGIGFKPGDLFTISREEHQALHFRLDQ